MQPLLNDGDRVWVLICAYDFRIPFTGTRVLKLADPAEGDVVLLEHPKTGRLIVKKIAGLPLYPIQTESNSGIVGKTAFSPIYTPSLRLYSRVPPGYYMVLGENQAESEDSRYFGFVSRDAIRGKVLGIDHNVR